MIYRMIVAVFLCFSAALNAQTVEKYDLSDPRNPDCPCHKYQKLAEEEYKQLLNKNGNPSLTAHAFVPENKQDKNAGGSDGNRTTVTAPVKDNSPGNKKESHSKKNRTLIKRKHKKRSRTFYRWKKALDVAHWDIWKDLCDPSSCYRWK